MKIIFFKFFININFSKIKPFYLIELALKFMLILYQKNFLIATQKIKIQSNFF